MKQVVEDEVASIKQGIVTILRTDHLLKAAADKSPPPPPIRRTLSADMSSKRWLAENGLLSSTQNNNKEVIIKDSLKNPNRKDHDDCGGDLRKRCSIIPLPPPPPYVPRPAKRKSSTTLSEKSLELCTESLGSETGSDSFLSSSYYRCSEYSYSPCDDYREIRDKNHNNSYESLRVVKYRSTPVRPFPPPIPSIISDGDSLSLRSRRENGRLLVEAVSAPPKNYLHARRGNGRLVLTLIRHQKAANNNTDNRALEEEKRIIKGGIHEEEGDKNEADVDREVRSLQKSSSAVTNSVASPGNKKPTFVGNEEVGISGEGRDHRLRQIQIAQSLPSPRIPIPQATPPCTAAASPFVPFEHFWRNKTMAVAAKRGGFVNPVVDGAKSFSLLKSYNSNDDNVYAAKQYMNRDLSATATVVRGGSKLEAFVPYLKGCKEPKRSLLIWEPNCIATS